MVPEHTRAVLRSRTWLFGLLGVLGILPGLMAPMLLDSPQASSNPALILLCASIFTFPLVCFGSVLAAWPLYRRKRFRVAIWVSSLPMVNLAVGIAVWCWLSLIAG